MSGFSRAMDGRWTGFGRDLVGIWSGYGRDLVGICHLVSFKWDVGRDLSEIVGKCRDPLCQDTLNLKNVSPAALIQSTSSFEVSKTS